MSLEQVKTFFRTLEIEQRIIEFNTTTATVSLAAEALGVPPARICKTLSFQNDEGCILIQTAGDKKISNSKFKSTFGRKARMLSPEQVLEYTGHPVGGVCAFAIKDPRVTICCDQSLKEYETLFPACGSSNSAVEMTPEEIYQYSHSSRWVDVCRDKE
jgi:prolyl-tRNA editing enzyme YbaK/EbsC (Cys-tRNA(Pro) deacylase)